MAKKKVEAYKARAAMRSLGIYKPEFEPIISIYAELREQYGILTDKFSESGYDFSEDTQSGSKKAPIVTTLESLRKDILAFATQLGLTPQGLLKYDEGAFRKKKVSVLANALKELNTG